VMHNSERPVVVCAADDNYVIPMAVMLRSLAEQLADTSHADVWVLDGGITPRHKRKVEKSLPSGRLTLHWHGVDDRMLADMPVFGHVSRSTYARFLIADILPPDLGRVIYLDVDIIVFGDVTELWNMPVGDKVVLAVPERNQRVQEMMDAKLIEEVAMDPNACCFNAGVMVVDLERWRKEHVLDRARDFVNRFAGVLRYWDQDILNCLFKSDWGELDAKWNRKVDHHDPVDERIFARWKNEGGVIHFASSIKPWTWWAAHPAKDLYLTGVDRTAWTGWRPRPPLKNTLGNRHWYGKWIRKLPLVGRMWILLNEWRKWMIHRSLQG
jgi:lipopolysaccharide biosynthesis glycosyltransferase